MARDLGKKDLFDSVKSLWDASESTPHLHLDQHKLFTLFSIAFQYLLFMSTKRPGAYILRIENSQLADKLAKKSKDQSTRRFVQSLLLPRKLKYGKSTFYLDFFHFGSWNMTTEIPKEKVQAAIIVKNTSDKPMNAPMAEELEKGEEPLPELPADYYLTSLQDFSPHLLLISYGGDFEGMTKHSFPFIVKEATKTMDGVTLGNGMDWDKFDS